MNPNNPTSTESVATVTATVDVAPTVSTGPIAVVAPVATAPVATVAPRAKYVARGITYNCRRVTLVDGVPSKQGRPKSEGASKRTVVYVPIGMEYDVAVHGPGVRFNTHTHSKPTKRILKSSVSYVFDDGIQPTVRKEKVVKAPKAVKAVKAVVPKIKTIKPAKAANATKSVAVKVADVVAVTILPDAPIVPASTNPVAA